MAFRPMEIVSNSRGAVTVACMLVGITLIGVAWFGVSGGVDVSEQILWIIGAGVPGVFLVGLGGVLQAAGELRTVTDGISRVADHAEALHETLVGHAPAAALTRREAEATVVVPANAATYHRAECALVQGKPDTRRIRRTTAKRSLRPCPLCEPDAVEVVGQAGS